MFILDFFLGGLMDQFIDWVYSQLVGFFGNFFAEMGNMGVELFEMSWVQSIVLFFSYLAWALYVVGLVVAVFEVGIEYQTGRASVKDAAISAVKGFMAVGCFTLVPVELYKLSVTLQASLTSGITGYGESFDAISTDIINSLQGVDIGTAASSGVFGGIGSITSPIMVIFIIIMMGYAVIKCFFSNLKRGGILLIQIAVGSLYMFSVPRGYMDGFIQWCKQIIGLCLTTFLQATILTAGLLVLKDHALLGHLRRLWAGHLDTRQHHVRRLCSTVSGQHHPHRGTGSGGGEMSREKLIYIASPYAGDIEANISFAKKACRYAIRQGHTPIAVHLLYPQMLDDGDPVERETGLRLGHRVLEVCDELWCFGSRITSGMAREIEEAQRLGIPIRQIVELEIKQEALPAEMEQSDAPEQSMGMA